MSVKIDGLALHLKVANANIPLLRELSSGEGTIHLEFESPNLNRHAGSHELRVQNDNDPASSVYLANAVLPTTGEISIREQTRNTTQSVYVLDYDVESHAFDIAAGCVACLALGAGILLARAESTQTLNVVRRLRGSGALYRQQAHSAICRQTVSRNRS